MFGGGRETEGKRMTDKLVSQGLLTKEELDKWIPTVGGGGRYLPYSPKEKGYYKLGGIFQAMGDKRKRPHPLGKKWSDVTKRIGKKSEEEWQGMGQWEGPREEYKLIPPDPHIKTQAEVGSWLPSFLQGFNP